MAIIILFLGGLIGWMARSSKGPAAPVVKDEVRPQVAAPSAGIELQVARQSQPTSEQPPQVTFELNEDFRKAVSIIKRGDSHVFVTGRAGTGKSTLLQHLRIVAGRKLAVVAPTGLAAVNVNGQTIHSLFRFPPQFIDTKDTKPLRDPGLLRALDLLVIDEASMVRADLIEGIDHALRINRRNSDPFGGVQIVFFGDLWQLPPVVREKELKEYFDNVYGGPYFFLAKALKGTRCVSLDLQRIYRQQDDHDFKEILQGIREGKISDTILDALNERVINLADPSNEETLTLTTTNDGAFSMNNSRLKSLPGVDQTFSATVTGKFDSSAFPTEPELTLKVGARVIFVKGDRDRRWSNGSFGTVCELRSKSVLVEVQNGQAAARHEILPTTWENIAYKYDRATHEIVPEVIGSYAQLPIRLGWAITIHKSQGQTFDRVAVDLGKGAFAHGQAYVALSRCRSLAGLHLVRPIRGVDVIIDPRVREYARVFLPA